ncbi:snoRNA-binding rRNA-processing protein [Entomophthora muscae]|uniref:SnoRNA-binding rRNA-processing protein n=2 Tax=Entomophthora muscae TaxID=34485 RepID=A0ACC2S006_9FUNG|nr:snoRNA-binding rRNA-processing protein [Entomophthora muscae]
MGKAPKSKFSKKERHDPLHIALTKDAVLEDKASGAGSYKVKAKAIAQAKKADKEKEEYIDAKLSKKILDIAREQQQELMEDESPDEYVSQVGSAIPAFESDYSEEEVEEIEIDQDYDGELGLGEIDEADRVAMEKFLPEAPGERINLADLILSKIEQKTAAKASRSDSEPRPAPSGIPPKVVEVYNKVGLLLSRYKSGKLPKAFKFIPSLPKWEEIIYLTHPENWTPHAHYEATRIFVSNLKENQTQRFFHYILLDKVRQDINDNKTLKPQLYMALKKALFKPKAFFKGILFPLCESGTCTLQEAAIVGSVLSKVSIPVLHSGAAIIRLANMEYSGANSLFLRILVDKKYALPYQVIDALVFHFMRFENEPQENITVLWHQSLLVFCQRYKQNLTPEQKAALLKVARVHTHHAITPEIRRELVNSTSRGEAVPIEPYGEEMME